MFAACHSWRCFLCAEVCMVRLASTVRKEAARAACYQSCSAVFLWCKGREVRRLDGLGRVSWCTFILRGEKISFKIIFLGHLTTWTSTWFYWMKQTVVRLVSLYIFLMCHTMQYVTQTLPQPFVLLLSSRKALWFCKHSICPSVMCSRFSLHALMYFPDLLWVAQLLGLRRSGLKRSHMRWFELLLQQHKDHGMELLV